MIKKVEVTGINVNIGGHRATITREEAEELCRELSEVLYGPEVLYGKEPGFKFPELKFPELPKFPEQPESPLMPIMPIITWGATNY